MTIENFQQIFLPAKQLIDSEDFLTPTTSSRTGSEELITSLDEALKIATSQNLDPYEIWADLRGTEVANAKPTNNKLELRIAWEEKMIELIEKSIPKDMQEAADDIESDLYYCCTNIFFGRNNPLYNKIWEEYLAGYWPCGWRGNYPNGQIVVYINKR